MYFDLDKKKLPLAQNRVSGLKRRNGPRPWVRPRPILTRPAASQGHPTSRWTRCTFHAKLSRADTHGSHSWQTRSNRLSIEHARFATPSTRGAHCLTRDGLDFKAFLKSIEITLRKILKWTCRKWTTWTCRKILKWTCRKWIEMDLYNAPPGTPRDEPWVIGVLRICLHTDPARLSKIRTLDSAYTHVRGGSMSGSRVLDGRKEAARDQNVVDYRWCHAHEAKQTFSHPTPRSYRRCSPTKT